MIIPTNKFTGMQYLKMDIAANFGGSNLSWSRRLEWFDENKNNLTILIPQAKEPELYQAGIRAYVEAMQGNKVHYPISLDASSSGE